MNLVYSSEAVADLVRLRAFIAEHNPTAAAQIASKLVERINYLQAFPEIGRMVGEAPTPQVIRDFAFGKYVVRYSLHRQGIAILRVWHHLEAR